MATIFSKVHMVYPWDSQVVMSLLHFQLDGLQLSKLQKHFIQLYADSLRLTTVQLNR